MPFLQFERDTLARLGLEDSPWFHPVSATTRDKLTTPLDLLKRRLSRYWVRSNEPVWGGGTVPTYGSRKRAEKLARAIASWGYCSTRVVRMEARWTGAKTETVATFARRT